MRRHYRCGPFNCVVKKLSVPVWDYRKEWFKPNAEITVSENQCILCIAYLQVLWRMTFCWAYLASRELRCFLCIKRRQYASAKCMTGVVLTEESCLHCHHNRNVHNKQINQHIRQSQKTARIWWIRKIISFFAPHRYLMAHTGSPHILCNLLHLLNRQSTWRWQGRLINAELWDGHKGCLKLDFFFLFPFVEIHTPTSVITFMFLHYW